MSESSSDIRSSHQNRPYKFFEDRDNLPIPFFFLGLAFYRAWIEILFVGSFISFPATEIAGQNAFDFILVVVLFACSFLSKKITPLFNKKIIFWYSVISLSLASLLMFSSIVWPTFAPYAAWPAVVLGGSGIAFLILLWSELYGCLNPTRVGLYYSLSLALTALLIYIAMGFSFYWLAAYTIVLPFASLVCVSKSFSSLPSGEWPRLAKARFSFPWKTVALMAIYVFAFGLKEVDLYESGFGAHSSFGTLAVALLVFFGIYLKKSKFDLGFLYKIGLPLMMGAFLILPSFDIFNDYMADFCLTASYASFAILTTLILANMSYRYGISAIWLFGIERGVRALFGILGRETEVILSTLEIFSLGEDSTRDLFTIILVAVLVIIILSEKELSSSWGVSFLGSNNSEETTYIVKKNELADKCHEIAKRYKLSNREEEVLFLLAEHKTAGVIERELFISNNTAKTHIKNIYRKLDIHSRQEVFDLIEDI